MKIAFLCHYFYPEINAPSARVFETAREWARSGHTVKVVTCFPHHPTGRIPQEYRGRFFCRESVEGVEVYRNWVFAPPNRGIFKRTLGHLSFMLSSLMLSLPRIGEVDVIIVSSPTFFSVISAYVFSLTKRVPYVFEVRDLWPAIFVELGVIKNRIVIKSLEAIEMFLYRRASKVVVVTESFRSDLVKRGIEASRIEVITNGADVSFYHPGVNGDWVRKEHGLDGKFVALYLGAHGVSQGLTSVLQAARKLSADSDIHFLLVGEGAEKDSLMQQTEHWSLRNITFVAGQPKHQVPAFYAASDVCLVPLRHIELFSGFIPSKIFEIMACGRPVIGAVEGETAEILRRSAAAIVVQPEDPDSLATAIRKLKDEKEVRERLADAGRDFVVMHYSRSALAARYEQLLRAVSEG